MPKSLTRERVLDTVIVCIGVLALITTAVQYPLSTTFPIGGDGAAHIATVQHVLDDPVGTIQKISYSWYPISYILFSVNALNPFVNWPIAFSWWMALGQIATGLALGFLTYRVYNLRAAGLSMAIWAMTPITLTSFFEDGTMAQLWSLPWLLLFIERLAKGSAIGMIVCCILALFSHPITALIMICTMVMALPHLAEGMTKKILIACTVCSAGIAALFISLRAETIRTPFIPESSRYFADTYTGFFLPWVLAAFLGWQQFVIKHASKKIFLMIMGCFIAIVFVFSVNDRLGIGFWTNRLNAYMLLCIAIGGAIGFTHITKKLQAPYITTLLTASLVLGMVGTTFHDNEHVYKRYETPGTYARIHPDELATISWIKNNLPKDATVVTSDDTRNYEWIPVLSDRKREIILDTKRYTLAEYQFMNSPYLVFFTHQEEVPDQIKARPDHFHLEFQNNAAAIFKVIL